MTKLQTIYKAIKDFKSTTKCKDSEIVVTVNSKTILEACKQHNGVGTVEEFLSVIMDGGDLKIFGCDLILSTDFPKNNFTVGFKKDLL